MRPRTRKITLLAHITASVGWLGSVLAFLALAILGLVSFDPDVARSVYPAMEFVTWLVIVPLSFASLLTGLIQSLGTEWGLFRHYWVVAKLGLNVIATSLLLLHTQPITRVAQAATTQALASGDLHDVRVRLVADAGAALIALLVATALSVFKPRGLTPYGRRKVGGAAVVSSAYPGSSRLRAWYVAVLIAVLALFALLHALIGGCGH
jgi:hypothetical protein